MRAILTYHAIDHSGSVISVTPDCFRSQITSLITGNVRIVGLAELLSLPDDSNAVALTFDDALGSVATEAAPLLAEHRLPATIFVVSEHVGGDNRWSGVTDAGIPVAPVLDWDALGQLTRADWSVGSHTQRHPRLTQCSAAELSDELEGSAAAIEQHLGLRPTAFAYPYGDVDDRVVAAAARSYQAACTTDHLPIQSDAALHVLPRLDAWYFRHPDPFRGWGTQRFHRGIAWRHALRRIRRAWR